MGTIGRQGQQLELQLLKNSLANLQHGYANEATAAIAQRHTLLVAPQHGKPDEPA